jgi:hypothetical protein
MIKAPRATEVLREYGYLGSVDVVRRRLRELRPLAVRPAQRTGYRPGQVLQFDWAEMPTRPRVGRERRHSSAAVFCARSPVPALMPESAPGSSPPSGCRTASWDTT